MIHSILLYCFFVATSIASVDSFTPHFRSPHSFTPNRLFAKNEATHDVKSDFQGEMDPEEVRVRARGAGRERNESRGRAKNFAQAYAGHVGATECSRPPPTPTIPKDESPSPARIPPAERPSVGLRHRRPFPRCLPARLRRPLHKLKIHPRFPLWFRCRFRSR